jgi:hypothetical protein
MNANASVQVAARPARAAAATATAAPHAARLAALDWAQLGRELDSAGAAVLPALLSTPQCLQLRDSYAREELFRSRIVMQRHGFGRGEYQYFRYPLPTLIEQLRTQLYVPLARIANRWCEVLDSALRYPETHVEFLERCHAAGQRRPTPLLLRYGPGDYNCLHQDLYGEHVFPLQATVLLSAPSQDFEGGEFALTEQRPRAQSRVEVVSLRQGDAVIFPVHHRPVKGARGLHRVNMRHGVSRVRDGERFTMGIVFHDAT